MAVNDESKMVAAAKNARKAALELAQLSEEKKNEVLRSFRTVLVEKKDAILAANKEDVEEASKLADAGKLSHTLLRRLSLAGTKFDTLLEGLNQVVSLEDPVGKCTYANTIAENLELYRVTCPIGVMCVIFEARPEACVQIASLALKSGNALLLKGGKEAARSNRILTETLREGFSRVGGASSDMLQLLEAREDVSAILKMDQYIDLVVPRGGNALVKYIKENTMIPVLGHADGICAVYLDKHCDSEKAARIVCESKTGYVSACNALETLLIHKNLLLGKEKEQAAFASSLLNPFALREHTTEFRCDKRSLIAFQAALDEKPELAKKIILNSSSEEDYRTEFLDYILAVKVVESTSEAVAHINAYGSKHTDAIVTESTEECELFMNGVDSADVFCNSSTRFADGFRFGFGAEIGISTNRIHSRGPVGLDGLVLYKYRVYSAGEKGHCVADVAGKPASEGGFAHTKIPGAEGARLDDFLAQRRRKREAEVDHAQTRADKRRKSS
ncbi:unnamed protein product [Amoebophrya sp. A25]|nr:unnamed protein product [Amoebophrya sp. A25]|eukprot:GSA25T00002220001.1